MMRKRAVNIRGLTLVELMVAAVIFIVVIGGLFMSFVSCLLLNELNSNLIIAANDAQYILEEVKGLAYADIDSYSPLQFNNLPSENITFQEDGGSDIKEVRVIVGWTERQRPASFTLSTRIAR